MGEHTVPDYISRPDEAANVRSVERVETPRNFEVLLHNDHYTTMEFVVQTLKEVFRKTPEKAVRIMRNVHENEQGVAGVYIKSVAEAKVLAVHKSARQAGYPLRASIQPE